MHELALQQSPEFPHALPGRTEAPKRGLLGTCWCAISTTFDLILLDTDYQFTKAFDIPNLITSLQSHKATVIVVVTAVTYF